jgi:hypothetical protein
MMSTRTLVIAMIILTVILAGNLGAVWLLNS